MTRIKGNLQQEKNGIWTAHVRVDGKTLSRSTGTVVRTQAEKALERLAVIAECGRKRTLEGAALLKAWSRYEETTVASRLAPGSLRIKYRGWVHFSVWMQQTHPEVTSPEAVTRRMAEEYLMFYQDGHATITCNLRVSMLKEMFRVILDKSGADDNPWTGIRLKAGDGYTRRELTLDEIGRLVSAARECGSEWEVLFSLGAYTGLRLGDCCRLKWESINMDSQIIQIVPHKTRRYLAGRFVTIPLHPELSRLLGTTPPAERSGFVMQGIATDYIDRRWALSRMLERIFENAQIETSIHVEGRERRTPSATFHSLRHTFVSIAANVGVPLAIVQAIVGHTSTSMTRHYYHPSESALRQAIDAIPAVGSVTQAPRPCVAKAPSPSYFAIRERPNLCTRLKELEKAKKRGLISIEEFSAVRKRILSDA